MNYTRAASATADTPAAATPATSVTNGTDSGPAVTIADRLRDHPRVQKTIMAAARAAAQTAEIQRRGGTENALADASAQAQAQAQAGAHAMSYLPARRALDAQPPR